MTGVSDYGWSMEFPLTLRVGQLELSAHGFFELASYVVGFVMLSRVRQRDGDVVKHEERSALNVAAILGGALGSKLVQWLSDPAWLWAHATELAAWMSGKSLVGGLLGGTLAVEWLKAKQGIAERTGDALVVPLIVSIAIGRIGCFFAGLDDHTYGVATDLPWGVNFGDGVARHPTQLYEVGFLLVLGIALARGQSGLRQAGARFDAFLIAYLTFRVVLDFWKPYLRWPGLGTNLSIGLAATQWAALWGVIWRCAWLARQPANFDHRKRGVRASREEIP